VPEKIKKQPPNHVVIVHWVSNTLTVLAQAPVPHADKTERRILFVDHKPGRGPQLETIGIARKNKRPDTILVQLVMAPLDRQEEELGLYERLLAEAAQAQEKDNPGREKHQKMRAYVSSQRKVGPGGGYVTSEEIQEEQERYLADLRALLSLLVKGGRGPNGGYWLAYLGRKYPTDYAHLRDIEIGSK
jgi:hypothetical protein